MVFTVNYFITTSSKHRVIFPAFQDVYLDMQQKLIGSLTTGRKEKHPSQQIIRSSACHFKWKMDVNKKCLFSTPDLSHTTSSDFDCVYEPAEDSFLMLDALEKEFDALKKLEPGVCLEVGCGSGICITFLANMLGPQAFYLCSDINPKAAQLAVKTAQQNGVLIHPVVCDLTTAVEDRLKGQVDILLFNPPYVVTPSSEVSSGGIEASWAGGVKGREVTDRFLPRVAQLLSPEGVFYLIVIKENVVEEIEAILGKEGFHMNQVISRRAGREHLSVLKFSRCR